MNPTRPERVGLCIYADLSFFNFTTDTFSKVKLFLFFIEKSKVVWVAFPKFTSMDGTQCKYADTFGKVEFF